MNPFVDPNKRDFLLPNGYKNLIDVLNQTKPQPGSSIGSIFAFQNFLRLILFQAKQDGATEVVIGAIQPKQALPIRYKVKDSWHELAPAPPHLRPGLISEILQMAKMPVGQFPNEGVLDITLGDVRSKWTVKMTSMDAECTLTRILD
jgi:hypothetical protein